ncbi:unnamed protein product [Discosporangium mesarthrocarpum]
MGSAVSSALSTITGLIRENDIEFVESAKEEPTVKADPRRRNSLMFFMQEWERAENFEQQQAALNQVKRYYKTEGKAEDMDDQITAKLNKIPIGISLGDMKLLRQTVIMKWKDINRSYQGPLLGDTLLHRVCREGYLQALQFMVDPNTKLMFEKEKMDPHTQNKRKRTPLMLCFTSPQFTAVAKEYGLRLDETTGGGVPNAQRPKTAQTDQDHVLPGGRVEREEMIRILLEELGAKADVLDMHGYSMLHYAAIRGWENSLKLLLRHGSHPLQTCVTGETALHFAASFRHHKAVDVLLDECPELLNEADQEGGRAIHLAIQNEDTEMVRLLTKHGADINSPNYKRFTPLKAACKRQDWMVVNILLDHKLAKAAEAVENDEARQRAAAAYGKWVPYTDKMGRGIFYYNKVSRESRWEPPSDYVKDKEYVMKTATFGMHFYH